MIDIKELLKSLNEEQIKPATDTEGAVLVFAGAGSGKTRVLTTRIAYLVLEKKVNPSSVLAITFTNKAAGEMKERLVKIIGDLGDMWVCTIHSMCVKILRSHINYIGYDRNFTIYDETDREKAIKRAIDDLGYEQDKVLKSAKTYISIAKNACQSPEEFEAENQDLKNVEEITKVYKLYQDNLYRSNSLDFDDLLYRTYQLFCAHPEVADIYAKRFKYIHIDEFQDTNKVQFLIAERLSLYHGNLFVVGDDDQSIYGWRGAEVDNILSFDKNHKNTKVYKLERNYRSTKKILSLANSIIKNNVERKEKELYTNNDEGARVEVFVGEDENTEASYTAMQIKSLMARNPAYTYKDFAVFMRVNALSRAYEQEFLKYNIPYKVYGGFKFFERKEIKDLLAYLKVINNPQDDESFLRSISTPKRGIGEKSLQDLREYAVSKGLSLYDAISYLETSTLTSSTKSKLYNYKNLLSSFMEYSSNNPFTELLKHVIKTTSFLEQYKEKSEENASKLSNIDELQNSAELFYKDNQGSTLNDYLASITLSSDTDDIKTDNAVSIATIHASKGLEFPCVFVAGLDEGIIPTPRSVGVPEEVEEERRLMYVAVTRAKSRLYLTRATSRFIYGRREYNIAQSRFLKEALEQENLETNKPNKENRHDNFDSPYGSRYSDNYNNSYKNLDKKYQGYGITGEEIYSGESKGAYSSSYAKTFLEGNKPKVSNGGKLDGIKTGVKVKHPKFGVGTIVNARGTGSNMILDIGFEGVGIKQLSASLAPLTIV